MGKRCLFSLSLSLSKKKELRAASTPTMNAQLFWGGGKGGTTKNICVHYSMLLLASPKVLCVLSSHSNFALSSIVPCPSFPHDLHKSVIAVVSADKTGCIVFEYWLGLVWCYSFFYMDPLVSSKRLTMNKLVSRKLLDTGTKEKRNKSVM